MARFGQQTGSLNTGLAAWGILTPIMANKLSDLSIDELQATLQATELSAGPLSTSARIIRRELDRKVRERPDVDRCEQQVKRSANGQGGKP